MHPKRQCVESGKSLRGWSTRAKARSPLWSPGVRGKDLGSRESEAREQTPKRMSAPGSCAPTFYQGWTEWFKVSSQGYLALLQGQETSWQGFQGSLDLGILGSVALLWRPSQRRPRSCAGPRVGGHRSQLATCNAIVRKALRQAHECVTHVDLVRKRTCARTEVKPLQQTWIRRRRITPVACSRSTRRRLGWRPKHQQAPVL